MKVAYCCKTMQKDLQSIFYRELSDFTKIKKIPFYYED